MIIFALCGFISYMCFDAINNCLKEHSVVMNTYVDTVDESVVSKEDKGSIDGHNGVFEGVGIGYKGKITVEVKVVNGEITEIKIKENVDDFEYFNKAVHKIIPNIISNKTTEVDVVAGATYSSQGIIDAVIDALSKAQV